MTDDERNDLLTVKASVEQHLFSLHKKLIELSASNKDDAYFDELLGKAKHYRTIFRTNQRAVNRRRRMNEARQRITDYIARMERATTKEEREVAYREMMVYHCFLPEMDRTATDDLMRPYWQEIDKIQLPPDPLVQRAEELLNRIQSRMPQS